MRLPAMRRTSFDSMRGVNNRENQRFGAGGKSLSILRRDEVRSGLCRVAPDFRPGAEGLSLEIWLVYTVIDYFVRLEYNLCGEARVLRMSVAVVDRSFARRPPDDPKKKLVWGWGRGWIRVISAENIELSTSWESASVDGCGRLGPAQ